jgi:hypothetical protein
MKFARFALALVVASISVSLSNAQGPIRKFLHGGTPVRDLFSGASSCGSSAMGSCASGMSSGSCSSATSFGACGTAATTAPTLATGTVTTVKAPVGSIRSTVVHDLVRLKVAAELRKQGKTAGEARTLAESLSDQLIEGAGSAVGVPGGFFQQLLADLMAFINSPNGQAILGALVKYLLALLGADSGINPVHNGTQFTVVMPKPLYLDQRELIYQWNHSLSV